MQAAISNCTNAQMRGRAWLRLGLVMFAWLSAGSGLAANAQRDNFWTTNGSVNAAVVDGTTLYIGGTFDQVGPYSGSWVGIDAATGLHRATYPQVDGAVYTMVRDGAGGWFIGGDFTAVGATARSNIAHIRPDFSVDPDFDPSADRPVRALLLSANTLYAGGEFTTIGGFARNRIAALDVFTGLATAWNPNANGAVYALAIEGLTLYAGGQFTSIGGAGRNRLAALDASGSATSWNPGANSTVFSLAVSGSTLYAGGAFSQVGGAARQRVAEISFASGAVTSWSPDVNSTVYAIATDASTVYLGGQFTTVGGSARSYLAAVDMLTGNPTAWSADADGMVRSLFRSGASLYVGGDFRVIGGSPRRRIAELDTASGAVTDWSPAIGGTVFAIARDAGSVFAGGQFSIVGGVQRAALAAIDTVSGTATDWDAGISGSGVRFGVYALAAAGDTLYVGGRFTGAGGLTRNNVAAIDIPMATPTLWDPNVGVASFFSAVTALLPDGDSVYIGGNFDTVGGETRISLAAVDALSGSLQSWDPGVSGPYSYFISVNTLQASADTLYAGGYFSTVGGLPRNNLVAIDKLSGVPANWDPDVSGTNIFGVVNALRLDNETLFVAGDYTAIGGQARARLATVDTITGAPDAWSPAADATVNAIDRIGANIIAGGQFSTLDGSPHDVLASIDQSSAVATAWLPDHPDSVLALAASGNDLYVGGAQYSVGRALMAFTFTPPTTTASPAAGGYSTPQNVVLGCTDASGTGCAGIHYTTDGSLPTRDSTLYTGPIAVAANTTLRFFASDNSGIDEVVQDQLYVIDAAPPVTQASVAGGTYSSGQSVILSCVDTNSGCADTFYTVDGSAPSGLSPRYTAPIAIDANATLRFYSVDGVGNAESAHSMEFVIDRLPPVVTATPLNGIYAAPQSVMLTCTDDNSGCAGIRYTVDGSLPGAGSPLYAGAIPVTANTRLAYSAVDNAGNAGPVVVQDYVIDSAPPVTTPNPGNTPGSDAPVVLQCVDENSGCLSTLFTLDGSVPTLSSSLYNQPIALYDDAVLRFLSLDNAGNAETVQTLFYVVHEPPVVTSTEVSVAAGSAVSGTLQAAGAGSMIYRIVSNGHKGIAEITDSSSGAFRYTADVGVSGEDTFTWQVSDGVTDSAVATVTVTIAAVRSASADAAGGGCTIGGRVIYPDPVLPLLVLAGMALPWIRRLRR